MNPKNDYWDNLMGDDETASNFMYAYGEGPGCETRMMVGEFIADGESVLDAGCGPGWNYDHFKEYGPPVSYKAFDLSPRFVRVAKKRQPDMNIEVGDVRDIKEDDGSFDVVILQDVLEHTNGYEKPVLEALRVARKRVIVVFWRRMESIVTKTNDDTDKGTNGYGSDYNKDEWENFLNTLPYVWFDAVTSEKANRKHWYYIIDKELK
jgi:ubiquinone/menaquinone biosynthesis C-methylase UbiE